MGERSVWAWATIVAGLALANLGAAQPAAPSKAADPDTLGGTPYADLAFKVDPKFTALGPSGRYFPPGPLEDHVWGYDVEACHVAPDLKLTDCQTAKEQPSGHLFAAAAKEMIKAGWMTSAKPDAAQPHTPDGRVLARVDFKPGGIVFGTAGDFKGAPLTPVQFTDAAISFFPAKAFRQNISGAGVVACHVTADHRFSDCHVREEAPEGYGFGDAVARMALAGAVTEDVSNTADAPRPAAKDEALIAIAFQSLLKPNSKPAEGGPPKVRPPEKAGRGPATADIG